MIDNPSIVETILKVNWRTNIWFKAFLSNINNFQIDLFKLYMELKQVLHLQLRVGLGEMERQGWVHNHQNFGTGALLPDAL